MENLGAKTIDELWRVIVPNEVRQAKGWKVGDKIIFRNCNGVIVLETGEDIPNPEQMPNRDCFNVR